jgi:hypothetical protein
LQVEQLESGRRETIRRPDSERSTVFGTRDAVACEHLQAVLAGIRVIRWGQRRQRLRGDGRLAGRPRPDVDRGGWLLKPPERTSMLLSLHGLLNLPSVHLVQYVLERKPYS